MQMILITACFLLPLLVFRFFVLSPKNNFPIKYQILASSGDLFLAMQKTLLFTLIPNRVIGLSFIIFLDFYVFLDAFLYSSMKIKMQPFFFVYLKDVQSFLSSIKTIKIHKFIIGSVVVILYNLTLFKLNPFHLIQIDPILYTNIFLTTSLLSVLYLNKKDLYFLNNIIIFHEFNWVKNIFLYFGSFFQKKPQNSSAIINENYSLISKKYPLLRFTKSFYGEKQFDIDLDIKNKPNIIFLMMESFRSKDIGCQGGRYNVSPNFDRLSKEGILFENFYSTGCYTNRAMLSSYCSIYPALKHFYLGQCKKMNLISICDILKKYDYQSSFLHNGLLSFEAQNEMLKAIGFDHLIGENTIKKQYRNTSHFSWGVHDEYLMKYSVDYLKENQDKPQFLSLVTISNHHPWTFFNRESNVKTKDNIPVDYKNFLQTFAYSDYCLGLFIDLLRKNNLSKNSIIFIFGDHGIPMDENTNYTGLVDLKESHVHVPLLVLADNHLKPQIIRETGSHVDLIPTLMDILNIKAMNHNQGTSLVRKTKNKAVYFSDFNTVNQIGCRKDQYKYIFNTTSKKEELYDLNVDCDEKNNIINESKKISENLHSQTQNFFQFSKNLIIKNIFSFKSSIPSEYFLTPPKILFDDELEKEIMKNPHVYSLDLSDTIMLTEQGFISAISKCSSLSEILLKNCSWLSDESLFQISKYCPKLISLNIGNCENVTNKGINSLLENSSKLEILNASHQKETLSLKMPNRTLSLRQVNLSNTKIDCHTLRYILSNCPFLEILSIDATNISNQEFSISNNNLHKLTISNSNHLSDETINSIINKTKELRFLSLKNTSITDNMLKIIGTHKNLSALKIFHNDQISDKGLSYVKDLPLILMEILKCPNLTDNGILHFADKSNLLLSVIDCENISKDSLLKLHSSGVTVLQMLAFK